MKKKIIRTCAALLLGALCLPFAAEISVAAENGGAPQRLSDLTGVGGVIAVIDAGFDVTHPAFSVSPAAPSVTRAKVIARLGADYEDCYLSEKLPFVCDYVGLGLPPTPDAEFIGTLTDTVDFDVTGITEEGTALASLAAGCYRGRGDQVQDDNTVLHDGDYLGVAPDAQLLLMKAASDLKTDLVPEAVAQAIRDAISLSADAILLDFSRLTVTEEVISALKSASRAGVPVFTGAGDMNEAVQAALTSLPAAVTERGTLTDAATLPAVLAVGAAADPFAAANTLTVGEAEIGYLDSSADYLGKSMAAILKETAYTAVPVPGFGRAADYDSVDVKGKIAVVLRGEIPFAEKAAAAADAGAVALIVVNNGASTERMALEGTSIPAVMVSAADGILLTAGEAEIGVPGAVYRAADFSARGLSGDFDAAVALLTVGENLTVAAKGSYDIRSGTIYAAARAAGYCACATEYARQLGLADTAGASLLLAAASLDLTDGADISPRTVGRGLLTADSLLSASALLTAQNGAAVSVPEAGAHSTFNIPITVQNLTDTKKTYTLTAAFTADTVGEDGILTGEAETVNGLYVTAHSGADLVTAGEVITLSPHETKQLIVHVSMTYEVERALGAYAPYGFFIDGRLTLSEADTPVAAHALSFFFGDLAASPLADVTVYEDTEPYLAASSLTVISKTEGFALPLGVADPTDTNAVYDEAYNLVNPKALKGGGVQLKLTALREIESVYVRVFDEAGHTVHEAEAGPVPRYLVNGGRTTVLLWDFTAADEKDYIFPEGTYTVEVCLTAQGGDAVQFYGFTLTADSRRPTVTDVTFTDDSEGRLFMTVTATDDQALSGFTVYDLLRQYSPTETVQIAGEDTVSATYDITLYDGESPLYAEAVDYAGGYTVRRFTMTEIAERIAAAREDAASSSAEDAA